MTSRRESSSTEPFQLRPFKCELCHKRFTRQENLKRHGSVHTADVDLQCKFCSTTFARDDLRRRHVRLKHPAETQAVATTSRSTRHGSQSANNTSQLRSATSSEAVLALPGDGSPVDDSTDEQFIWASLASHSPVLQTSRLSELQTQRVAHADVPSWTSADPTASASDGTSSDFISRNANELGDIGDLFTDLDKLMEATPTDSNPAPISRQFQDSSMLEHDRNALVTTTFGLHSLADGGRPPSRIQTCPPFTLAPITQALLQNSDAFSPNSPMLERGVDLYFKHNGHYLRFVHRTLCDRNTVPKHLLHAICCLGYLFSDELDSNRQSVQDTSMAFYNSARQLLRGESMCENTSSSEQALLQTQSYLLLLHYAMFFHHGIGEEGGFQALNMHTSVIRLARKNGLMQPSRQDASRTADLPALWHNFVDAESRKRTMLELHLMDSLLYQILSVPRSISHLEMKHEMPCHAWLWESMSAAEWAYRSLAKPAGAPLRYSEAVRCCLNGSNLSQLPSMTVQGSSNVIHFLQTSLREITGWSTMTGQVSLERFETLTRSLSAIGPYLQEQRVAAPQEPWFIAEATWHMSRIDSMSWSASHMGGIVESSLGEALATACQFSISQPLNLDNDAGESILVHVEWFITFLRESVQVAQEPPYVTVYAFKAVLLGLQLVRGIAPQAFEAAGIEQGDFAAAVSWAQMVFGRRQRWKVGQIAVHCLKYVQQAAMLDTASQV